MIKSITVTNHLGESIKLELARPELSGFMVMSVTGLGPGKANINTTETATNDGSIFNSSRVTSRNIVFNLRYMWKNSIEDARQLSYKYFPIKKRVTLLVETDNRSSEIEGYVESNEPDIFSETSGADISIVCPYPFFHSASDRVTTFGSIEGMFEFPFGNESLTEPLLVFSEIRKNPDRDILYTGDADVGVRISLRAHGEASNISIYNVTHREVMRIDTSKIEAITGSGIIDKDEIVINTVQGEKSAFLIREGVSTNILNAIDRSSDWFKLRKGTNVFSYVAESGQEDLELVIENKILYEGV